MFTKFISTNIQEKMKAKERALGWKTANVSEPSTPTNSTIETIRPKDIMSRTTFVRMCSNKIDGVPNVLIAGGEIGEDGQMKFGTDLYSTRHFGLGSQFKPIAGIKDVTLEYKGGFKAIRTCTVNWVVNSLGDLDFLTPYFLTVGKTVVLDMGWIYPNKKTFPVTPFITKDVETGNFIVDQSIFTNPQEKIIQMDGDYEAVGGAVSNFTYNLRADGGFDCSTTIVAMGVSLLKLPLDKGHNQAQSIVIDDEPDNENEKKSIVFVPPDNLVNAMINLRNIIYHNIFMPGLSYISEYQWKQMDVYRDKVGRDAPDTLTEESWFKGRPFIEYLAMFGKDGSNLLRSKIGQGNSSRAQNINNVFPNLGKGLENYKDYTIYDSEKFPLGLLSRHAVFVDNKEYPNVMVVTGHDTKMDMFVTWAWFEDQLINRYTSFTSKNKDVKITFRSLDTALHNVTTDPLKIGEPISSEFIKKQLEGLSSLGNFDVKRESIRKQFGILLDADVSAENFNDIVKVPTLIRNPPLLYSTDPDKFWIKETLPTEDDVEIPEEIATLSGFGGGYNQAKAKIKVWEAIRSNENIRNFNYELDGEADKKPKGVLRNIWVNIKEIQDAFGIQEPDAFRQDEGNVRPPGTLENGVKNLLNKLNSAFNNAWNFDIVSDPYDSTNIKIIDKKTSTIEKPTYSTFEENSHKIQEQGIYQFPAFNIGSIVKNQQLDFKLPDSMAVTVLYGSNKEKGRTNESELAEDYIGNLFRRDSAPVFKDKYLENLRRSNQSGTSESDLEKPDPFKAVKIGSEWSSYNSKLIKDNNKGSFNVFSKVDDRSWWKRWISGTKSQNETDTPPETKKEKPPAEKLVVKYDKDSKSETMIWVQETRAGSGQFKEKEYGKGQTPKKYYLYDEKKKGAKLIDDSKYALRTYLNSSSGPGKFSADVLIPAELGLDIDGIGGIVPGDIVHTTYIQPKYNTNIVKDDAKLGPLVYFMVMNVSQKFDTAGWTTTLNTRMRMNSIPNEEGLKLEKIKANPVEKITKTDIPPAAPPEEPGVLGPDSAFSGFGLNNTFTLPPLETFKPKANPEDYIEPKPEPEKLPTAENTTPEPFIEPQVINNGIPPEEETTKKDESIKKADALPETPPTPPAPEQEVSEPEEQMEIIRVVKSPGQPRIVLPATIGTVKKPQVAVEEVTTKEIENPEVAYVEVPPPPPPPKKIVPPKPKPKIVETPVQKVKREQKQKAPKKKANPTPRYTTYRPGGTENGLIYQVIPNWRTKLASTSAQQTAGDYKQEFIYGASKGEYSKEAPVPKYIRQNFWDDNIEPPNSTGVQNQAIIDANVSSLLNSGKWFSSKFLAQYDFTPKYKRRK